MFVGERGTQPINAVIKGLYSVQLRTLIVVPISSIPFSVSLFIFTEFRKGAIFSILFSSEFGVVIQARLHNFARHMICNFQIKIKSSFPK